MKPVDMPENEAANRDRLLTVVAENRDHAAFRTLFDYFAPRIKSFARRRGADLSLAEKVVQETMVRVWTKAGQFDPQKASSATWVFTIARNLHVDMIREAARPEPDTNDPSFLPDPELTATDAIALGRDIARLRCLMGALPGEQREVLTCAFLEEMTHPEIAEQLDIPLGTVKSRIRLALKRVREGFGDPE